MARKRRGRPWGPSNPLWRWQHRGSRRASAPSRRTRRRRVRRMGRPRMAYRYRRRRGGSHRSGGMIGQARKYIKVAVNTAFKITGAIVATIPLHRGLSNMITSKDVAAGAKDILFDTTGISEGTGPDIGTIVKTGVTVGGGLFIAWLGGQVARHL